ncbi:F-box/LRR-repeat/kelch-repeat protein At1g09650 [Brassica rapa]|nr:F-box/LRR-repeat/kelch-repeat protein At1g09650 [Brassica rapa]
MKQKGKRNRSDMGQVPQVLVEEILERLDVKSLVRFTSVSKQWSSMIKSRSFALRHLIRAQSRDPHILVGGDQLRCESNPYPWLRTLELLDPFIMVNYIPKPNRTSPQFTQSCDGLVCIYDFEQVVYVFNPATRWCRFLPPAMIQQINNLSISQVGISRRPFLGFGKDAVTSKYKIVWLYNPLEPDLDGQTTTCEVFDFTTYTWRHVIGSPHLICDDFKSHPVHLDGSINWLTAYLNGTTKIVCFDLHTEVFQVMSEIPIAHADPHRSIMCSLHNRLCVSEMKRNNIQDIWLLNSLKVWEKTYSINLTLIVRLYGEYNGFPISPVTVFDKTRLLYLHPIITQPSLLIQDTIQESDRFAFSGLDYFNHVITFVPSLISI